MRTVEETVYAYDELSDRAKEKARDWYRKGYEFDPCYEPYETAAELLGIDITKQRTGRNGKTYTANTIQWSGFCSQGDGASFTGTYSPKHSSIDIRKEFPTDTVLHKIADALTNFHCRYILAHGSREWSAKISQSGNYCHKYTMQAEVYDHEGEEMDASLSDEFLEIMRDFAQWIYDGLEEDYNYQTSDEEIVERIRDNEYKFNEYGEVA